MTDESMKTYTLIFANSAIDISVKVSDFPTRRDLATAVRQGRVIRTVITRLGKRRAQYVNLALVERIA